jgi:hypothetical protein
MMADLSLDDVVTMDELSVFARHILDGTHHTFPPQPYTVNRPVQPRACPTTKQAEINIDKHLKRDLAEVGVTDAEVTGLLKAANLKRTTEVWHDAIASSCVSVVLQHTVGIYKRQKMERLAEINSIQNVQNVQMAQQLHGLLLYVQELEAREAQRYEDERFADIMSELAEHAHKGSDGLTRVLHCPESVGLAGMAEPIDLSEEELLDFFE